MKWYISGPITSASQVQRDLFYLAEKAVLDFGYEVINPMRYERPNPPLPVESRWEYYMRLSIKDLVECDGIIMLPYWRLSKGSSLEKEIAESLNMEMVTWDTFKNSHVVLPSD